MGLLYSPCSASGLGLAGGLGGGGGGGGEPRAATRDGSSLDSHSKDSYSSHFFIDSTDSRAYEVKNESMKNGLRLENFNFLLVKSDSKKLFWK